MGQCFTCLENVMNRRSPQNSNQYQYGVTYPNSSLNNSDGYSTSNALQKMVNEQNHASENINLENFSIIKVIGRGSFGKVYLVEKIDDGKLYAMKTLKKDQIIRKNQKQNTKAERMILEKLNHPFIVKLHYAFQTPEKLYFVIDFLNGGELFYHLRKEGKFSEERTRFYAAEIILALECLHKNGVIYRDLKPENVILDSDGHIKLTDFGLSKMGVSGEQMSYTFCGTPEYLAPEIVKGSGHNKAVDWWSLGLMIYEMLCGINPFKVKNKNKFEKLQMITEVDIQMQAIFSEDATSLLKGLLERNPKRRLGYQRDGVEQIKDHPFFSEIDWDLLLEKKIRPPFVPKVDSSLDLSNIDKMFTKEPARETPEETNLLLKKAKFDNFTFVEENHLTNINDVSYTDIN